jgi:LDH2 family malate/lactate/ureidoglycolate dehydrogenase
VSIHPDARSLIFDAQQLHRVTTAVFVAAGAPEDIALEMSDGLVEANLAGHDSHGVLRIPEYIGGIEDGRIDPRARPTVVTETRTSALVDGNWAFGQVSARFATDLAIAKAKDAKTAVISLVRCNHIGQLGRWSGRAAAQDVIALIVWGGRGGSTSPQPLAMAPYGGAERAFGTNPIAIGLPGGDTPDVVVDFATAVIAEGKLRVHRAEGTDLPAGCILDKEGRPSVDPNDFYDGGVLLPFGGHKGYALAMFIEMLCGAFSPGDQYNGNGRRGSVVVWAVDACAFRSRASYTDNANFVIGRVKGMRPAQGFDEVLIPGEPEIRSKAARLKDGILISQTTWDRIIDAGRRVGVDVDLIVGGGMATHAVDGHQS